VGQQKTVFLQSPEGGLQRRVGFQEQPPFYTAASLNVRPRDFAGRRRPGNRPGLGKAFAQLLGGGNPVRLLHNVKYVTGDTRTLRVVASAGGLLYRGPLGGTLTQVPGAQTLASDRLVQAAYHLGKLWIADWTDAPAGRTPKVYDPVANTLSVWTATSGTVPTGCPLIARYRDRIVLAGASDNPQQWFMSKQGDARNWDYTETGPGRAVSGLNSEAGNFGEPVTALIPHSDECMLMAGLSSLWIMRGDPAQGGHIDNVSQRVGPIQARAWCYTPEDDAAVVFLGHDGVYAVAAGCSGGPPVPISRQLLPEELLNVDPAANTILLGYDLRYQGIRISITPNNGTAGRHWWLDWGGRKGFWEESYPVGQQPTAMFEVEDGTSDYSLLLVGCRDGVVRRHQHNLSADDGTNFSSFFDYGPLQLNAHDTGMLRRLDCQLTAGSGAVTSAARVGETAEDAFNQSSAFKKSTKTLAAGLNASWYAMLGDHAAYLRMTGAAGVKWSVESVRVTLDDSGRRRV